MTPHRTVANACTRTPQRGLGVRSDKRKGVKEEEDEGERESWLSRWYFQFHRAWVNEARGLEKLGRPSPWNILCPRQKWALWSQCYTSSPCSLSVIRSASFWWRTPLNVVPYRALTGFRYITFADYRPASRSMSPSHPRDTYLLQSSHPFLWLASVYLRDVGVGGNVRDERTIVWCFSLLRFKGFLDFTVPRTSVLAAFYFVKNLLDTGYRVYVMFWWFMKCILASEYDLCKYCLYCNLISTIL